jgi:hypothetical protein
VVVDKGKWEWSELWRKEDWWAIWLGALALVIGLIIFLPRPPADMDAKLASAEATKAAEEARAPFQTIEWHQANDTMTGMRARSEPHGKTIARWLATPERWRDNPSLALPERGGSRQAARGGRAEVRGGQGKDRRTLAEAKAAQEAAAAANFQNPELNSQAEAAIGDWRTAREAEAKVRTRPRRRASTGSLPDRDHGHPHALLRHRHPVHGHQDRRVHRGLLVRLPAGGRLRGHRQPGDAARVRVRVDHLGHPGRHAHQQHGGHAELRQRPALQTEYFIKTGLVLLGAEILFGKIVAIGIPGIFVAWVVTPTVLTLTYIFGQKVLKMESKTLNITVSADMSVCGVSAAIATAAACRAKKEELTIAVGMSMLFTAVMMIALPTFIVSVGMHPVLGGAWIGGTIDSTGAVVAAGAFLGETGMFVAATIKMIQNVMIGVIAFGVAVYWCARVDCAPGQRSARWRSGTASPSSSWASSRLDHLLLMSPRWAAPAT